MEIEATITENYKPSEMTKPLIENFTELLASLKKDKVNSRKLCNFLRYPYSSVYEVNSASWQVFEQEEPSIDHS